MRSCRVWSAILLAAAVAAACDDATGPNEAEPASLTLSPAADTLYAVGDTLTLTADVRDEAGAVVADAEVEWRSLDDAATVDSVGRVTAVDAGVARIVARADAAADTALISVHAAVSADDLTFFEFAASAPELQTRDTSFWAVKGDGRQLVLHYVPEEAGEDGETFMEFEVPGDALLRRPDGTSFAEDDSVLITLRVDDAGKFLFTFEPSGLVFDPDHPASLDVRYGDSDGDGDGDDDEDDDALRENLAMWRQDDQTDLWVKVATAKVEESESVEAKVLGFSRFALASN